MLLKNNAHEETETKNTQAEPGREKQQAKVMVLTTANEQFHKITVFRALQENEKVCFNQSRHSKPSTPPKNAQKK